VTPSSVRWYAMLVPIAPPPTTTTSADSSIGSVNLLPGRRGVGVGGAVRSVRLAAVHRFDVEEVRRRLVAANGGYEVVHESPGIEVGVYVLVAPEPDRQQPHEDDEIYVGLEGTGVLEVEGQEVPIREGAAIFVEAGAEHRFTAYESLSVLVIFERARR
jgi:mannose-6-phosphate isomerase-like protein (cupin superfamily)